MSAGSADDESNGGELLVGVGAQLTGDAVVTGAAQKAEGGVAQEDYHGRPGPGVGQAGILAEDEILRVVEPVLGGPMTVLER